MNANVRPILSISILISNHRADTIEKCMESLVSLREAVPSELIIVDTGCKDEGIEIARRYADKVISFAWCNDFAAARNSGLSECTGEWFLFMDDDEWFEDTSELIAFFQGEERYQYDGVWYIVRNYKDYEGTFYSDTFVGRAVRLKPGVKFCGKVHEWLEPIPVEIKKVKDYAHHYGYAYKDEEAKRKHAERNIRLAEEVVKENPEDLRMCCQLEQEYRVAERYEDAAALCRRVLDTTEYTEQNSYIQYLLFEQPRMLHEQQEYEKALDGFLRLEETRNLMHMTKLAVMYEKIYLYAELDQEEKAQKECLNYIEEYRYQPKAGEPREYEVMGFAQYRSEFYFQMIIREGIKSVLRSGDYTYIEDFFAEVAWDRDYDTVFEMLKTLLQCYMESGKKRLLQNYLPGLVAKKELEQTVYSVLHGNYMNYPERREMLVSDLESLNLHTGNFPFFHLLYAEGRGEATEQDVRAYFETDYRRYDAEVVACMFTNTKLLSVVLDYISVELYTEAVALLVSEKEETELQSLWEVLPELMPGYSEEKLGFLLYAVMVIAEKRLVNQRGSVRELLLDYMNAAKQYAAWMYHPEVLNERNCVVLPANLRFVYIMDAAMAQGDFANRGEGMIRAAKEYPVLLSTVKALLAESAQEGKSTKKARNENTADTDRAKQELLALAAQLKLLVRSQLAEGKTAEAREILSELAQMLPEDEEVKEMQVRF